MEVLPRVLFFYETQEAPPLCQPRQVTLFGAHGQLDLALWFTFYIRQTKYLFSSNFFFFSKLFLSSNIFFLHQTYLFLFPLRFAYQLAPKEMIASLCRSTGLSLVSLLGKQRRGNDDRLHTTACCAPLTHLFTTLRTTNTESTRTERTQRLQVKTVPATGSIKSPLSWWGTMVIMQGQQQHHTEETSRNTGMQVPSTRGV